MKHMSILAVLFLCILLLLSVFNEISPLVPAIYAIVSLITFIIYGIDKSAARKRRWRTPESTLHVLSVAGGWPGALIAQQVLRHKTKKKSFRIMFWISVLGNCALAWMIAVRL